MNEVAVNMLVHGIWSTYAFLLLEYTPSKWNCCGGRLGICLTLEDTFKQFSNVVEAI